MKKQTLAEQMDRMFDIMSSMGMKPKSKRVVFNNGSSISIQASEDHYNEPRDNEGPYSSVELGFPSEDCELPESVLRYMEMGSDDPVSSVFGFVPASAVVELIELNGGIVSGQVPPLDMDSNERVGELDGLEDDF